uniref:Uncharacterized protein n=1 Tax=viral metagenome TaxID=1070528 RepID=A0A6C0KDW3_9ZZZZ
MGRIPSIVKGKHIVIKENLRLIHGTYNGLIDELYSGPVLDIEIIVTPTGGEAGMSEVIRSSMEDNSPMYALSFHEIISPDTILYPIWNFYLRTTTFTILFNPNNSSEFQSMIEKEVNSEFRTKDRLYLHELTLE